MAAKAKNTEKTKTTKIANSQRVNVIVSRKHSKEKHKIFASTTIIKNGREVLEQFRVPVDTPVSIPIEVARIIRDRKVVEFENDVQTLIPEFLVENATQSF